MLKQICAAIALAASSQVLATEHWIDVRIPEQYQQEHIAGAINIPLSDIRAGHFVPLPKDDTLYLYCNSGRQSALAQQILQQSGYLHVVDKGGMNSLRIPTISDN